MSRPTKPLSETQRLGLGLKRLRLAKGLTQEELAGRTATNQQTIQRYEAGAPAILRVDIQRRLAEALGETDEQLRLEATRVHDPLPALRPPPGGLEAPRRTFELAVVGRARAGETGIHVFDTGADDDDTIDVQAMLGKAPRATRAAGDSMLPRARNGAFVIYDTGDPFPRKEQACIIITEDGEMLLKLFERISDGKLYVEELHPVRRTLEFDLSKIRAVYAVTSISE